MLDGFDLLSGAFVGPRGPGPEATPGEKLAAVVAQLLFPTAVFCLVWFAGLWQHGTAVLVLAGGLSLAAFVISRLLSQRLSFAVTNSLAGALWIFLGAGAGFLFGFFTSFYSGF